MRLRARSQESSLLREHRPVPGLAGLSQASVARALELGRLVHIPKGWTPIHAGEPADRTYLLLEGRVRVVTGGEPIADLGPGAFVGEMGLVEHSLRSARITILEPALTLAWPADEFQRLRTELSDFEELVVSTSAARVRENEERR